MVNILSPFFLLSSICTFLLGVWVICINPRSKVYLSWLLFCQSVALWSFGLGILTWIKSENIANNFYFVHYLGAIHIPVAFLYFVRVYFLKKEKITFDVAIGVLLAELQLYWFWVGDLVGPLTPKWLFTFYTNPGKYYVFYMVYFAVYVTYSFYLMLKSYAEFPTEKKRKIFFMVATALGYTGGSSAFLLVYINALPPFGILIFPLFPILTTYAIVRHRFMDIEVIIKKTIVFAGIAATTVACIAIPIALAQVLIGRAVLGTINPFLLMTVGVVTAILIYRPVERRLVDLTDRYLFQKKYSYRLLLKENSKQLALIKSLDEMAKQIVAFLIKQGRIRNAGIFMQSPDQKRFELRYPLGYGGRRKRPSFSMENDHPLVKFLVERKTPIVLGELEKEAKNIPSEFSVLEEIREVMRRLKAEVIIPSFLGGGISSNNQVKNNESGFHLRNVLVLGPKKSDEEYTDEDLDVFFTIAQDSAIAAENARLFDTVLKEREAKVKAEHLARRAQFAGLVKHETKSKLTYIDGPARDISRYFVADLKKFLEEYEEEELSEKKEVLKNEFLRTCDKIQEASRKINAAVDRVLIIAQTASAGINEKDKSFQELDCRLIWEDAKEESGLKKQCDFESNMPEGFIVYCNYHALQRTLVNLITNAYDAMKSSDEPLIKLRCSYENMEGNRVAHFEVQDFGCGIHKDIQKTIFEDGFSTKPKPDTKDLLSSGHGQGLAACKIYIEGIHNGKLWFESEAGRGTTFKFWVPMKGNGESNHG